MFTFDLTLNKDDATYNAGDDVEGKITVILGQPLENKGINVRFKGTANVHWAETYQDTTHYLANVVYFDDAIKVFTPVDGFLPAGHHIFPFKYSLPLTIPSTAVAQFGCVKYRVKARMYRPWNQFDDRRKKEFFVKGVLDLNQQLNAGQAIKGSNFDTICCCCCQSGSLSAEFQIKRKGYLPGDTVIINAKVENNSDTLINHSCVHLLQEISYYSTSKTKTDWASLKTKFNDPIAPGETQILTDVPFELPDDLLPTHLAGCSIMDVRYTLRLEVVPSACCASDLFVPLEIIIGTVPLSEDKIESTTSYRMKLVHL